MKSGGDGMCEEEGDGVVREGKAVVRRWER
jgi:hypothetical protein